MTTVTRSTSVVLVQTATSGGNTIVTFPNISTNGRLITVRDNDGYASTGNAIILSTTAGATFQGISGTLAINQPFGFITLNSQANGAYSIVNSFAFPSGSATANVSNLITQNIFVGSTIQIVDRGTSQTNTIFASSSILYINNSSIGSGTDLISTVDGLGSAGYLSSIPLQFPIPPVWVAVGRCNASSNTSSMQYSLDGATWCNTRGPQQGFLYEGRSIAYYNDLWVAVGDNSYTGFQSNLGYNQWSVDGSNWQYSYGPLLGNSDTRYAVHYANGLWHSVGRTGGNGGPRTILWSTNGKNWNPSQGTPFNNSPFAEGYAFGVTFGNGVWVVAGAAGNTPSSNLVWSSDGSNWNPATNVAWSSLDIRDVEYDGSKFIALPKNGSNASASNICISTDGKNWTSAGITGGNLNNNQQFVAGNGNQWLIISTQPGSNLLQSLDGGFTWQNNANITNCNVIMGKPYWDGSKWFIGIQTGQPQNNIYYSTDGITWTTSGVKSQYTNFGFPFGFASSDGQSNLDLLLISTTLSYSQSFETQQLTASTIFVSTLFANAVVSTFLINYVSTTISSNVISSIYANTADISTATISTISTNYISAGQLYASSIGIGTTAPVDALEVRGNALFRNGGNQIRIGSATGLNGGTLTWNTIEPGAGDLEISAGRGAGSRGFINFYTNITANTTPTTTNKVMTITNNSVGIGLSNPSYALDVNGQVWSRSTLYVGANTSNNQLRFYGTSGDIDTQFTHTVIAERIYGGTQQSELLFFKGNDTGIGVDGPDRVRVLASGGFHVDCAGTSSWLQGDNPPVPVFSNCLVVNGTTGFVGIRTSTPSYALDVNGQVWSRSTFYVGSSSTENQIRFYGTSADGAGANTFDHTVIAERFYGGTENSELLFFKANDRTVSGSDRVRVLASGGFQVDCTGTTSTWLEGGAPPTPVFSNCLVVNGDTGFVGIGTSTPQVTLDIKGILQTSNDSGEHVRMYRGVNGSAFGVGVAFDLKNSANQQCNYAILYGGIANPTAGQEQGYISLNTYGNGNNLLGTFSNTIIATSNRVGINFLNGTYPTNALDVRGNVSITGSLSKGSGSFEINHPIISSTKLVHSFIEGPRCDLIYRGQKQLSSGIAIVDLESESTANGSKLTPGTFKALCTNPQVYLQNNKSFDHVKGYVSANLLCIDSENTTSSVVIDWLVIAERHDPFIKTWNRTDSNGLLILEHPI